MNLSINESGNEVNVIDIKWRWVYVSLSAVIQSENV